MLRWEPPHDPNETETREVGFEDRLATGETIASATWTTTPSGGSHLTQVSSSASADGLGAVWRFSGGVVGTWYEIVCRATTSAGNVLEETIILRCEAR